MVVVLLSGSLLFIVSNLLFYRLDLLVDERCASELVLGRIGCAEKRERYKKRVKVAKKRLRETLEYAAKSSGMFT